MNKWVSCSGHNIEYELIIKQQKNIVLTVVNGKIKVSAPSYVENWQIQNLIYKNIKKINGSLTNYQINKKLQLTGNDKFIFLFGVKFDLVLQKNLTRNFLNYEQKNLYFKHYEDEKEQQQKIYNFLRIKFAQKISTLTNKWAKIMELEYDNLSLKILLRKWGICYPKQKKIILNVKLLHFEEHIIDYVIVHELTHLIHQNHSNYFWYNVEKYLPNYREKILILKNPGV